MAIFITPGGAGTPGGSDTQIQFNDNGAFGGDAELTYNKTTNKLTAGGDVELNDGGSFTTTLQVVTPTANQTISLPNATGTVGLVAGSSGQVTYNSSGAYAGLSTVTTDGTNVTLTGRFISSLNGAASAPPGTFTGTWFTGGTSTTTKPQVLIEPAGATSTAWSTSGTGLGVNAASGFTGNLLDLQVNGSSDFAVYREDANTVSVKTGRSYFNVFSSTSNILRATAAGGIETTGPSFITNRSTSSGVRLTGGTSPALFVSRDVGADFTFSIEARNDNAIPARSFKFKAQQKTNTTSNIAGGGVYLEGGDGSSGAAGAADGGSVYLDGGIGYGTGVTGNVVIGSIRGNLQVTDARDIVLGTTTGTKIGTATTQKLGFFGATPVVQQTELTDELTTITHTAPGTPDYAIQNLTDTGGFGFASADEGNTVLSVIANLQTRVNELETKLVALGLLADAD